MIGFHSDMMWLPDHGVGAVILTNGDPGWILRAQFRRKLLEVLFDGKPEADEQVAAQADAYYVRRAAERETLTIPADPALAKNLAKRYVNEVLGRYRRASAKRCDHVRLWRMARRGRVTDKPRWFGFLLDRCPRH